MRLAPLILMAWVFLLGCRSGGELPTIWRTEVPSPDGYWVARAHTEQNGGFGSASIYTVVELKRANGSGLQSKPTEVLAFDCLGPAVKAYTLSEANAGGTIHLQMKWSGARRLDVTYDGRATVNLQVAKLAGVDISLTTAPVGTTSP